MDLGEAKTCHKCKLILPLDLFSKHRGTRDGLRGKCRACVRGELREWNKNNQPRIKAYRKARYAANVEAALTDSRARSKTEKGRQVARDSAKRHRLKYPDRIRARSLIQTAVKYGFVVRDVCEKCGNENTHAHHDDYSMPYNIRWLCPKHHRMKHGAAR